LAFNPKILCLLFYSSRERVCYFRQLSCFPAASSRVTFRFYPVFRAGYFAATGLCFDTAIAGFFSTLSRLPINRYGWLAVLYPEPVTNPTFEFLRGEILRSCPVLTNCIRLCQ
jgi:hypothetical protein